MKKLSIILMMLVFIISVSSAEEISSKKTLFKKYISVIKDGNNALNHADPQYIMITMGNIKELLTEIQFFEKKQKIKPDKDIKKMKKNLYLMRESLDGLAAPSERPENELIKENLNKKKEV